AVSYLEGDGIAISFVPSFADIDVGDDQQLTAISFKVESRKI
ncbi:MAG: stage V sporulation protein S, partial [Clostridia bacterium]|nr:stage V sporulation protein S [Clostridia bacterium]